MTETQLFVFQMYGRRELWGRRLKRVNKFVKQWLAMEKENEETEIYEDLLDLKNNHIVPALRLYNKLVSQEFVRVRDEQEFAERTNRAVETFNSFVKDYSVPPDSNPFVPFDEL